MTTDHAVQLDEPPRPGRSFSRRPRWGAVLAAQIAVACATGLFTLGRKSLWFDETFTFSAAHRSLSSLTSLVVHTESNMAPYNYLLHFWLPVGRSEATLRLLSVVFFVATVPLLATVVDRTFGRRTAVLAGFLLAVNPFAVVYAQELRAYSMVMCGVTASTALFVECVLRPRRRVLVGYVVVAVLSSWAHYFALLVIVAQAVSLAWVPDLRIVLRRLRATYVALVVLSVPLLAFIADHRNTPQIDWITPLTWSGFVDVGHAFLGEGKRFPFGLLLAVALLGVAAVTSMPTRDRGVRTTQQWGRALVWCWLIIPVLLTVLACFVQNLWVARYLIVVLPAFVALLAVGAVGLRRPALQLGAGGLVVAISVAALAVYYPREVRFQENWRGVSTFLASPTARGHAVLFNPGYLRRGADYYPWARGLPAVDNIGIDGDIAHARTATPAEVRARLRASPGGIAYVVQRGNDLQPALGAFIAPAGYRQVSVTRFGTITVVRIEKTA